MAWKVNCVMDERVRFVAEVLGGRSVAAVCREFGVSRKTGHKWLERYAQQGPPGLADRSRAPHVSPQAVEESVRRAVVAFKRTHLDLGPKKIVGLLERRYPQWRWPAPSTVGALLKAEGLVSPRRTRRSATPSSQPLAHADGPNTVWCADFKGWFLTGDGRRCTPLTISDAFSRYLLRCQGLGGRTGYGVVRPLFDAAFREFGMPSAIRTDNGPPFATSGLAGLSELNVWWMRLGIRPERIRPGHPEQNGRHERMHRTLKQGAIAPAAPTLRRQQQAFDRFARYYNHDRPHEALGQSTPAEHYTPSPRSYPIRLMATDEYPAAWEIRKVKDSGRLKWRGQELYLAKPLTGLYIGLQPVHERYWLIHFMHLPLGVLDDERGRVRHLTPSLMEKLGVGAGPDSD